MIKPTEAIRRAQLNDVGGGHYTVNYADGGQVSGLLSCNPPNGHFTVRNQQTDPGYGPYELCKVVGGSLVFSPPWGGPQHTYIVPFVEDAPNG